MALNVPTVIGLLSCLTVQVVLTIHHRHGRYNDTGSLLFSSLLDGNTLGLPLNSTLRALSAENGTDPINETTLFDIVRDRFFAAAQRKIKLTTSLLTLPFRIILTPVKAIYFIWKSSRSPQDPVDVGMLGRLHNDLQKLNATPSNNTITR